MSQLSVHDRVWSDETIGQLIDQLLQLRRRMDQVELTHADRLARVIEDRRASAKNLLQYLTLRQQDLRSLQEELSNRGLSSLGRCEANVYATLTAVIEILCRLAAHGQPEKSGLAEIDFDQSRQLIDRSTSAMFGPRPAVGGAHIMVTMPSEAADDYGLMCDLVAQGMDCMRVNCAHDDASVWKRMVDNLHRASDEQKRHCKILMDLGGPKLRTGAIEAGPKVLKWRPRRDAFGRVIAPARIWFREEGSTAVSPLPVDATIPVIAEWFPVVQPGDEIRYSDARGRSRRVRIIQCRPEGFLGEADRTSYITSDTQLKLHSSKQKTHCKPGYLGTLPSIEQYLVLRRGDRLLLGNDFMVGSPAKHDEHGQIVRPATIGCTLPSVFRNVKVGERVLFDDGKIAACIQTLHENHVELEITNASLSGTKLRADKGINLPDSRLQLGALTDKDIEDLAVVVQHADMVGYSFVRSAEDVERLQSELARLGRPEMPIVLKIENRQAFEHLPSLLLAAMQSPASGVMIARGDLAVELGWQRLAEVQEEILWMCEAAHMPVIWATQVLESLAKSGLPSRAEITDAAMSVRAECVMLNKGPYILEAMRVLSDILRRMRDHQIKKRPLLRRLHLADDVIPEEEKGSGAVLLD
jgi:pyruvate kinase